MEKEKLKSEVYAAILKYRLEPPHALELHGVPGTCSPWVLDAVAEYVTPMLEEIERLKEMAGLKTELKAKSK